MIGHCIHCININDFVGEFIMKDCLNLEKQYGQQYDNFCLNKPLECKKAAATNQQSSAQ